MFSIPAFITTFCTLISHLFRHHYDNVWTCHGGMILLQVPHFRHYIRGRALFTEVGGAVVNVNTRQRGCKILTPPHLLYYYYNYYYPKQFGFCNDSCA